MANTFDQPLADPAALPLFHLSRAGVSRRLKVVLTGDGGDELLAGYRQVLQSREDTGLGGRTRCAFSGALLAPANWPACRADPLRLRRLRSRLGLKLLPERRISYYKGYWEGWERHRLYAPPVRRRIDAHEFEALDQLSAGEQNRRVGTEPHASSRSDQLSPRRSPAQDRLRHHGLRHRGARPAPGSPGRRCGRPTAGASEGRPSADQGGAATHRATVSCPRSWSHAAKAGVLGAHRPLVPRRARAVDSQRPRRNGHDRAGLLPSRCRRTDHCPAYERPA